MRTTSRRGRGCLGQTSLGAGAGRRRRRGGVCRLARTRFVWSRRVCVRACVFACGHSSRHQPLSLTRGSERPLSFCPVSFPPLPPAPPPPRGLSASGRPVQGSGPAGTGKALPAASFSTEPFSPGPPPPPPPLAVRPLGVHSSGVRPAAAQLTPTPSTLPGPHRYSSWAPPPHLGFPSSLTWSLLSLLSRFSAATQTWPLFAGGCRRPPLAP